MDGLYPLSALPGQAKPVLTAYPQDIFLKAREKTFRLRFVGDKASTDSVSVD
jgi:hypothetical protein